MAKPNFSILVRSSVRPSMHGWMHGLCVGVHGWMDGFCVEGRLCDDGPLDGWIDDGGLLRYLAANIFLFGIRLFSLFSSFY